MDVAEGSVMAEGEATAATVAASSGEDLEAGLAADKAMGE